MIKRFIEWLKSKFTKQQEENPCCNCECDNEKKFKW